MFPRLIIFLAALVACTTTAKLPKKWKTCKRNDPNLNACIKKTMIEDVMPDVLKGVPSLGILPMSPLKFVKLEMGQRETKSSPVAIKIVFKDIDIYGFENAIVDSVNFDWNKGRIQTVFAAPNITIIGNYEVEGKILLLPILGDGPCNFTIHNAVSDLVEEGSFVTKNGKKYFHVDKTKLKVKTDRIYMYLDNLFNGDKTLGDNMNKVLNENWEEAFASLQDTLEGGFAEALKHISNRLFDKVPFDEIAPN